MPSARSCATRSRRDSTSSATARCTEVTRPTARSSIYVERLTGYKLAGPPIGLPIYSTLFAPTCVGEVRREVPLHLANLRAARKATKKPVKISYTGIQVLAAATNNQYYKETKELALAIAKAFNEDFKELADNGCDIIQLDEFVWPYGMGDWEIEALNTAVEGVSCQFWVHT